ncbi:flagellar motor switch protein FliN [Alphaproteobacteria bacterium]|nr:flagellar motor switch protein FliN [Alphaproteobacteria bacterium]
MTETENDKEPEKSDEKKENLDLNELDKSPTTDEQTETSTNTEDENIVRMASDLEPVYDIPVQVSAVLGKTRMEVSDVLKLGKGAVVELDRKVGEAIDIYVNNRLVARGEVVVVENKLGVTMTEIIKTEKN